MAIVWSDVVALSPSLADVSAEAQALILAHVALEVGTAWGTWKDRGQLYLAAHLGAVTLVAESSGSSQAVGPVVSQTVGPVSRTYAVLTSGGASSGSFASTTWGQEYLRIRALLPVRYGVVL